MATTRRRDHHRNSEIRRIRSKGALLVLLWSFLMHTSAFTVFRYIKLDLPVVQDIHTRSIIVIVLFVFTCPIIGWIADVYLGIYRVIKGSMWLAWIGTAMCIVANTLPYLTDKTLDKAVQGIHFVFGGVVCCSWSAFVATELTFGTDQMFEASGDEMSALIHWRTCIVYVGIGTSNIVALIIPCSNFTENGAETFVLLILLALLTLALCSDVLFHAHLLIEPQRCNPWKIVIGVLRYSITHKHPVNRSALTYCEEFIPSRLDLGKSKYGGPFTTEQVENVKTCLRIMAVIMSITTILIPFYFCSHFKDSMTSHFSGIGTQQKCTQNVISTLLSHNTIIALAIPVHELLIHPRMRDKKTTTLQRLVIAGAMVVFLNLYMLIAAAVSHYLQDTPCILKEESRQYNTVLPINYYGVSVPYSIMIALVIMLQMTATLEFICAQAPYNMKGILIGLSFSVIFISEGISDIIETGWYFGWRVVKSTPSCEYWYSLTGTVLAIAGLVVMCLAERWYKWRQRDEPNNIRIFVENYFDRHSEG